MLNTSSSVKLHVLNNDSVPADMILGRDFLRVNNIVFIYDPSKKSPGDKLELLRKVASITEVEVQSNDLDNVLSELDIERNFLMKDQVISIIREVDSTQVKKLQNDYLVKIVLKDDSIYTCRPRQFALSEKLQIRNITDDLLQMILAREIIKKVRHHIAFGLFQSGKRTVLFASARIFVHLTIV